MPWGLQEPLLSRFLNCASASITEIECWKKQHLIVLSLGLNSEPDTCIIWFEKLMMAGIEDVALETEHLPNMHKVPGFTLSTGLKKEINR